MRFLYLFIFLTAITTTVLHADEETTEAPVEPSTTEASAEAPTAATTQSTTATPPAEPTTVSEIVVTAVFSYCDPETMRRRLPSDSALLTNFVEYPGHQIQNEPSKNPNYFVAGFRSAHVTDIDYTNQKLKIYASYMSCLTAKCDGIVSANSNLTLEREMRYGWDDDSIVRHYTVSGEVEFSQMYDAKFEDVEVACPKDTCQGIVFYGPRNRNFYTATRVGDHIERKLVVNGGLRSEFVLRPNGTSLERCPAVEAPESAPPSRSRRRR